MKKKQFKAESQRLLDLMINSIYTHQEIFLREIISNASDAIDKLAYLALTDSSVGLDRGDFHIDLTADKDNRILIVSDNGIGMSKDEMETNLGTIAKSGSLQFKQENEKQEDIDIIGQFGVGFYSAFMVSENVKVISKKFGSDEAWLWESSGVDGYTLTPCEKAEVGTDVIMKLKNDSDDERFSRFLEQFELQSLVKKYSDYIRYPIRMETDKSRKKEGTDDEEPEYESYTELTTLNSMLPLWQRAKKDISAEEYETFYREKFYDYEKPISNIHFSVEGALTYKALLYIPGVAPYDYYTKDFKKGLQLYSSGVLITDRCEDLVPDHFRFVRGVVDTQDLSLNISREMLQHNRQLKLIASNLEKKIKAELLKLQENSRADYEKFFTAFGRQLKYGLVSDYGMHKELLQDLILFRSAKEDKLVSLKEYVSAMPEGQKVIYFLAGESFSRLKKNPAVQTLLARNYDVLLMTEDVDEFIPSTLQKYMEKSFCNCATDDLQLADDEEKKAAEASAEEWKDVLAFLAEKLEGKISKAELSDHLGDCPVSLAPEGGMSFEMEKYFRRMNPEFAESSTKVMHLNPGHKTVTALRDYIVSDPEKAAKYAELLYCQGLLLADLPLEDPYAYTALVCNLL